MSRALLSREPLQLAELIAAVAAPDRGAVVTFLGLVRDHHAGREVRRLVYDAYESMAEAELARLVAESEARWPVRVALCHRLGDLGVGEAAVAVAVASAHRQPALEACGQIMEELKRRVPIWKKEFYADGSVAWVDPTQAGPPAGAGR